MPLVVSGIFGGEPCVKTEEETSEQVATACHVCILI